MKKQIIVNCDPLRDFKEQSIKRYKNCSFFEHNVNQIIDIGEGQYDDLIVREHIITDGKISLQRKNPYHPNIIWQNTLVQLDNGLSISINISDATFMINIIHFGKKTENEIHIVQDDKEALQKILNFLYHQCPLTGLSSIYFKSASALVLETAINGTTKQETLDFNTGYSKTNKKQKRK